MLDTLVQLYAQERRYTNALETLDKLEKLTPDNLQLQMNRATVYFNTKEYDKALAALDQVLQRDAKNIPGQLYKIFIFVQTHAYEKASPIVENVLRLEQDNAEALTYKGVIAIEKKDYSEAIAPLNRVLEARPNDWNALRNRAIAYLQMGKLDKARRDYQQLMRIIPHYYVAYYGLGEIAYREKENAAAIKQYENYLKHFPTDSTPDLDEEKKQVANRLKDLKMAKRW